MTGTPAVLTVTPVLAEFCARPAPAGGRNAPGLCPQAPRLAL